MGSCQCSASKALNEQPQNELQGQPQPSSSQLPVRSGPGTTVLPSDPSHEKRRGKKAVLMASDGEDVQDNVKYIEGGSVSSSDVVEIKKALAKHFVLSQLSEKEAECLIKEMRPCSAQRQSYIFKQGDRSGAYYILLEGVCQVEINGDKKRTLTFGDSFGDLGIIYNAPRSASVLALTDCELVGLSRSLFRRVMEDLTQLHEAECRKCLEVLSFFGELTQQQKNALAGCCLTETYEEGQPIFSKGDDANSFYVLQEGQVKGEKGTEILPGTCFGEDAVLEGAIRNDTLTAVSKVRVISISSQNVKTSLGGSLRNVLRRNLIEKVLKDKGIWEKLDPERLAKGTENVECTQFKKGELVLKKDSEHPACLLVLLNSQLKGTKLTLSPNSIIQPPQESEPKSIRITEDLFASGDGTLCRVPYEFTTTIGLTSKIKEQTQGRGLLEKKMQISDFHVVRRLRQGNFGRVYACWHAKIAKLYAIKVLDRSYVEKSQIVQYIMNEQQILRTVPKHPFVVGFHKLLKDHNFIYLIMELVEGQDLFDSLSKSINFPLQHVRFLVGQILTVLQHLHASRIVYRDLKPQNLMVGKDGYLTLVDMGTAKKLKIQRRFRTNTIIGTPHYIAPEIISGKGYTFTVDLWSLGVITYQLLCGKLPFGENSEDPFTIYEEIVNVSVKYPRTCPKNCRAFIEKMLSRSPQNRMGGGYQQLKKHIFFQGFKWQQLLDKQLQAFYKPETDLLIGDPEIEKALAKDRYKCPDKFIADKSTK